MYSTKEEIGKFFSGFKKSEKFYKKKKKITELPNLITLTESPETLLKKGIKIEKIKKNNKTYKIYNFDFPKGFKIIKNYLSPSEQLKITQKALNDFPSKIKRKAKPHKPLHIRPRVQKKEAKSLLRQQRLQKIPIHNKRQIKIFLQHKNKVVKSRPSLRLG